MITYKFKRINFNLLMYIFLNIFIRHKRYNFYMKHETTGTKTKQNKNI